MRFFEYYVVENTSSWPIAVYYSELMLADFNAFKLNRVNRLHSNARTQQQQRFVVMSYICVYHWIGHKNAWIRLEWLIDRNYPNWNAWKMSTLIIRRNETERNTKIIKKIDIFNNRWMFTLIVYHFSKC